MDTIRFAVDLPNPHDPEGECVNMGYFATRKEAIDFVSRTFGGTGGLINLVSELPSDGRDELIDAVKGLIADFDPDDDTEFEYDHPVSVARRALAKIG